MVKGSQIRFINWLPLTMPDKCLTSIPMETLRYVVLANALLAVVSTAYYALLRRETFFATNRLMLWMGLAGALLLPLLELPDWRPQRVRTVMHRTAQVIVPRVLPNTIVSKPPVTITFPNGKVYSAFHGQSTTFVWSWQIGLIALYLVGVALLLIRFSIQLVSLRRLIHQSVHEPYDDFTLVRNAEVTSPFSFFNWVVLNPEKHSSDELEQILRRERVHVRERHSFDMIGAELVCILFWFNPAAYLFRQLLHQALEFSADRTVLAEGINPRAYQYNLLKVSLSSSQQGLTNSFNKSFLKLRIAMMNRSRSTRATWLKYLALLLATLTVATLFAHPKAHTPAKFLPQPAAQTLTTVIGAEPRQPVMPLPNQALVGNIALPAVHQ